MDKSIYSSNYGTMLKLLIAAREAAGLTQQELGLRLGETQSFISKCERGERRLDIVELWMWCAAMDVTLSHFVEKLELSEKAS